MTDTLYDLLKCQHKDNLDIQMELVEEFLIGRNKKLLAKIEEIKSVNRAIDEVVRFLKDKK